MAEKHFVVVIDGVRQAMSSSQFETHFGHKPTRPDDRKEYLFGGRYENSTWVSGSINTNGLVYEDIVDNKNVGVNSGSI